MTFLDLDMGSDQNSRIFAQNEDLNPKLISQSVPFQALSNSPSILNTEFDHPQLEGMQFRDSFQHIYSPKQK